MNVFSGQDISVRYTGKNTRSFIKSKYREAGIFDQNENNMQKRGAPCWLGVLGQMVPSQNSS